MSPDQNWFFRRQNRCAAWVKQPWAWEENVTSTASAKKTLNFSNAAPDRITEGICRIAAQEQLEVGFCAGLLPMPRR